MEFLPKDAIGPVEKTRRMSRSFPAQSLDRPANIHADSADSPAALNDRLVADTIKRHEAQQALERQEHLDNGTQPQSQASDTVSNLAAHAQTYRELTKRNYNENWRTLKSYKITFSTASRKTGSSGISGFFDRRGSSSAPERPATSARHWSEHSYATNAIVWVLDTGIFFDFDGNTLYSIMGSSSSGGSSSGSSLGVPIGGLFRTSSNEPPNTSSSPTSKGFLNSLKWRKGDDKNGSGSSEVEPTPAAPAPSEYDPDHGFPRYILNQPTAGAFISKDSILSATPQSSKGKGKNVIVVDVSTNGDKVYSRPVPAQVTIEFEDTVYSNEGTTFLKLLGPWVPAVIPGTF